MEVRCCENGEVLWKSCTDVVMVCSSIQLFGWSSGLGRRWRMFFVVRSFCLVR